MTAKEKIKKPRGPKRIGSELRDTHNGIRWRQCYTTEDFECATRVMGVIATRSMAQAFRYAIRNEFNRVTIDSGSAEYKSATMRILQSVRSMRDRVVNAKEGAEGLKKWSFWMHEDTKAQIRAIKAHWNLNYDAEAIRFAIRVESALNP